MQNNATTKIPRKSLVQRILLQKSYMNYPIVTKKTRLIRFNKTLTLLVPKIYFLFEILDLRGKLTLRLCAIAINSKVSIKDEHKSAWKPRIRKNWIWNNVEYFSSWKLFSGNFWQQPGESWLLSDFLTLDQFAFCFLDHCIYGMWVVYLMLLFNVDGPTFKCLS